MEIKHDVSIFNDTSEINFPINMYDPTRDYNSNKEEYDDAIQTVLNKGNFINGNQVKELESSLADYVGVKDCICVGSGTDALQIALMAIDVGHGDEVITVPFTWISTSEVISLLGAKPVYVDIRSDTFAIDESLVEKAITPKTKAILPVSLYGFLPDYTLLNKIADKHGIPVIEDASQSFGSVQNGNKSCGLTTIGCTSFFPTKPLGCYGDGGALFTNNKELGNKIRAIKNHGALKRFHHKYIGVNSRLDTIQASILKIKLKNFKECLTNRQNVAMRYNEAFYNVSNISIPESVYNDCSVAGNHCCAWAQYSLILDKCVDRDSVVAKLKEHKIGVAIFYPNVLHQQECFKYLNYPDDAFKVASNVSDHIINLPCYGELKKDEQDYIIQCVINIINKHSSEQSF